MNDSEDLLSIGQVSEICRISIKTLRYYDKIGLLKPIFIDSASRYRYYSKSQLALISLFKELKSLGCSANELRTCFGNKDFVPEKVFALLDEKMSQVTKQLEDLQKVQQRLAGVKQIFNEMQVRQPGHIEIKHMPSRVVAFIKSRLKLQFNEVTARMIELANLARENNLIFKSGMMTINRDNNRAFGQEEGEIEVCCEVFQDKSYEYPFIREIPSGLYASIIHEGDILLLYSKTLPRLYQWIEQHKYEAVGPPINAYLDVPDGRVNKKLTIDVQVPVIKKI